MKLRIGPVDFTVELVGPDVLDDCGATKTDQASILVRNNMDAQQMMVTLWHEVGHGWDAVLWGSMLSKRLKKEEEGFLDQLAAAIHMTLRDNWKDVRDLYDGLAGGQPRTEGRGRR